MGTFSHDIFLNILHNSYAKHIHIINKLASGRTAHPNNNFQLAKEKVKGRQMFQRSLLNNPYSISLSLPKMAWPSFKQIWNSTKMQKIGWNQPCGFAFILYAINLCLFFSTEKIATLKKQALQYVSKFFFFLVLALFNCESIDINHTTCYMAKSYTWLHPVAVQSIEN